jgi:glucosylglycerate synthase
LADESLLSEDLLRQLMSVGEADLLVAIPTYNNEATIGQTIQAIEDSYQQNFVRDRVAILAVDGGSSDQTQQIVANLNGKKESIRRGITSLRTVHRITAQYGGGGRSASQGAALKIVFSAADLLRVKACAVVSPATVSLDPAWVANLLRPAYRQDFAFVAPLYSRTKFQGLLARNLLYPMSRAVFGVRIREMYADEWGFSGRLASECASQPMDEAVRARPEAWMAVNAICNGMKCSQSYLGPRTTVLPGGPDIVETIRQTVGNLFYCCDAFQDHWLDRNGTETVQTFGSDHELTQEDAPARQDKSFEFFRNGVQTLQDVLKSILPKETLAQLKQIAAKDIDQFDFPSELWVRVLYDFAAAYHRTSIARDHILQALVPLYRGQLFSFLADHAQSTPEEMEADTEALCLEFEKQKPYLIERWKAKS